VLGAAVAATAAVTFGSAGIAQACTDGSDPITACVYVQNNTGYTVYSSGGNLGAQTIGDGTTFSDAVPYGDAFNLPTLREYRAGISRDRVNRSHRSGPLAI